MSICLRALALRCWSRRGGGHSRSRDRAGATDAIAHWGHGVLHQPEGRRHGHKSVQGSVGLTAMGVAPVGTQTPNTGHHHLLIDTKLSDEELNKPVAADAKHVHFGGGQTEAMVTLPPGGHTLQLVLGDWSHIPHNPPVMSAVISVTVK